MTATPSCRDCDRMCRTRRMLIAFLQTEFLPDGLLEDVLRLVQARCSRFTPRQDLCA
jgi:hypothetical protein